MGLIGDVFRTLGSGSLPKRQQERDFEPPKRYTLAELVILEQEQSGERWHGVPLSELSRVAQEVYHGKSVSVDDYGFLVFHYTSNSGKTRFHAQCELGEDGRLRRLPHHYYPGQWRDSADDFVEMANQRFVFD